MYEDEWETSSGLPLDGQTVTISAFEFGHNAQIGAGVVCANVIFTTDDGEDIEQSFSVGKSSGEPSRDGGELVGTGKIPGSSNYGRLIDSVHELLDDPGSVIGRPRIAEGWLGTRWTMGTTKTQTRNPQTGETREKDAFVFVKYHGKGDETPTKPTKDVASAKKAAGAVKKTAAPKASNPAGIDQDLWDQLVELASEHETHDAFTDAAYDLVEGNPAATKAVMRENMIWAAAHPDES